MLYGGHVLEHAKDEGISLLGIESCYMVGALIHHMVCWKKSFNMLVLRMSFPPRCFFIICSLRKDNNACLFVVLVFMEPTVQVMLLYLSVAIPNPAPGPCTATLKCE